jgi:hypothetical protein
MVRRWTKDGKYCWDEPPYTKEEDDEFYRRTGNGPVAFTRPSGTATQQPPPPQSEPAPRAVQRRDRAQRKDRGTP